ncbi:hypothetical protein PSH47_16010 [Pseudoalteromonas sp. CST5]|uniref:hypothetical protein n=1 Tax=unclassified Pseudoalteromonas TaxID=194690 RepID=UPI002358A7D0|nr:MULTISPECIES: hypothetical protein [unclassified Pseudoalteromonas]MDC9514500.1 hypothetical protein [Pseudoalteromonas sp. CST1]MDC9538831.1 hypothetical protein [Pseudoalteromonas sp. CST3]MDC9543142.1 hypothetical protein [Pseudoalteromonas sp. CST2]MDC9545845.1 hypothetical protein [Pseudoalteromonas sp. CST4]MDC9550639.1 hypothetical protein [Pseudoalteromonas sp. CST5]
MSLDQYLTNVQRERMTFNEGLSAAREYVEGRGGKCEEKTVDGNKFYILTLGQDEAFCFQLYPDIDRFYFET